jgi:hypothetical protein
MRLHKPRFVDPSGRIVTFIGTVTIHHTDVTAQGVLFLDADGTMHAISEGEWKRFYDPVSEGAINVAKSGGDEKRAPDILEAGAATFRERNALYGNNYLEFGRLMVALFPDGMQICTEEEWVRLSLLFNCASKLSRYAANSSRGGHADSAHDLMVYAAMLQEVTQE